MNPNQIKTPKGYLAPEDATPETPAWRIVSAVRSAVFTQGEHVRQDCHSRHTAPDFAFRFCSVASIAKPHPAAINPFEPYRDLR